MTTSPEFTIYIKVGALGHSEEKTETLTLTWDPNLPEEINLAQLQLRAQILQTRLSAHLMELFAEAGPQFLSGLTETD